MNCTVICLELMDIFECILAVAVPPLLFDLSLLSEIASCNMTPFKGEQKCHYRIFGALHSDIWVGPFEK